MSTTLSESTATRHYHHGRTATRSVYRGSRVTSGGMFTTETFSPYRYRQEVERSATRTPLTYTPTLGKDVDRTGMRTFGTLRDLRLREDEVLCEGCHLTYNKYLPACPECVPTTRLNKEGTNS